jgi:hypothetical protein
MSRAITIGWRPFLLRYKRQADANTLLTIGGATPSQTLARIAASRRMGRCDDSSYALRVEAVEKYRQMYKVQQPIVDVRDPADWANISEGGYMRKMHGVEQ